MDTSKLTLEQKVVLHLAKKGYLTNGGDIQRALKEFEYADKMITALNEPGLKDDIKDAIESGEIEGGSADCSHESLTNEEIQEVFDNDNK
jgi:hypothetical protein